MSILSARTLDPPAAGEARDASEERYREIFEGARVALWDQDFSPLVDLLERLRGAGVTDVRAYFEARPDELSLAIALVRVRDVNNYAVELFEAEDKKALLGALGATFLPETRPVFLDEMVALWEGKRGFESEAVVRTLKGRRLTILLTIAWGGERSERSLVSMLDISKQIFSEQARQQLAAIVESSEDAIVSKDLNGVIVSWNRGAERLFGYTADEAIGNPVTMLIPDDLQDEEPLILARIRSGQPVDHYETVRRRKDGSLIDISLMVSPVKDAKGRTVGASKIARDITERRRAQAALARRMEEQAALFQLTDRLHRATSLEDVYEAALNGILRALGCARASILLFDAAGAMRFVAWRGLSEDYRRAVDGHSPWTPDDTAAEPILVDDVVAADLPKDLKSTIRREGIGALAFIPLFSKGRLLGKFMTYYDATHGFTRDETDLAVAIARQLAYSVDRVRAEDELRQNEERLRLATQTGKVGLWEWDIAEDSVSWTDSLYGMHGVKKDEFNATVEGFSALVHPEDRERVYHAIQRTLDEDAPYELEFRISRPDGRVVWIFTNAFVLRSEGRPIRLVGASVDITERKEAELQRDLLVAELSHRVKNTLATVISVARQSFLNAQSADEASRAFNARIRALAQTHGRLAEANWSGVSLETMLSDEFAPYRSRDGKNVRLSGPPIVLTPRCALTLGMAVHELATNAAKYGALSTRKGKIDVAWQADAGELRILWSERGGPPVAPPSRSGFGRLLLERALGSDLRGNVQLDFAEDGLKCAITVPLEELRKAPAPGMPV